MLSFVVQNFYRKQFLLGKTKRYLKLINLSTLNITSLFIKINFIIINSNLNLFTYNKQIINLYQTYFVKNTWKTIKKYFSKQQGRNSNNLLTSIIYWYFRLMLFRINGLFTKKYLPWSNLDSTSTIYLKPVIVAHLSFQKDTYNKFIIYILNILPIWYLSTTLSYNLYYNFIFINDLFYFYPFLRKKYFKTYRY